MKKRRGFSHLLLILMIFLVIIGSVSFLSACTINVASYLCENNAVNCAFVAVKTCSSTSTCTLSSINAANYCGKTEVSAGKPYVYVYSESTDCTGYNAVSPVVFTGILCPTCSSLGRNCGDNGYGLSCGTCTSPNTCGGGGTANVCGCTSSCTCAASTCVGSTCSNGCGGTCDGTKSAVCPAASTIDCGVQITSTSGCGSCSGKGTKCSSGKVCFSDACCTPESDATFCSRLGKNCGSVTANDNCGTSRTVSSCGSCTLPDTCRSGICVIDWYLDYDNDNFGNNTQIGTCVGSIIQRYSPNKPSSNCGGSLGTHYYVPDNTDCDNALSNVYPGASEICDGKDNDCDGSIDEEGCINSVGWKNLLGVGITGTYINNTVLMGIGGTNLNVNNLNYKISGPQSFSSTFTRTAQSPSFDSHFWAVSKSGDPFNFNASIIKGSVFISSKLSTGLRVNNTPNNTLPVAIITTPPTELNVKNATNINFNQASYDEDDLLKITWDFGDGTKKIITNYVNNPALIGNPNYNTSANVTHTYSSSGKYAVRLTAEEMTRGQSSESVIFINVFNLGINVIPIISSPENETKIEKRAIFFNASKSFVVDCSSTNLGRDIIISGLNIYCKYIHRPGAIPPISGYKIEMNWIINGDVRPILKSGNYSDAVSFWQEFASNGDHNVSLTMKYIDGSVSSQGKANKNFNVETLWNCYQEGSSAYWWDNQHNKVTTNCSFKQNELGYSCCPVNKQCFPDGSCRNYASYCFQLNKTSCDLFVDSVPEKSINQALCSIKQRYNEGNLYCSNMTNCFCKWNSSSNICEEGVNSVKLCWTGNGTIEDDMTRGQCLWSTTEITDNCNNSLNNMITKKKASWVNSIISKPDWCEDIEKSYQCVVTEKLPFFDKIGVIIAIIFIISAYIYVLRRQKRIVKSIERKINPKKTSRHEKKKSKR